MRGRAGEGVFCRALPEFANSIFYLSEHRGTGDYSAGFLAEELRQLGIARDELAAWQPPAPSRR